jgi:hypothetical protein
MRRFIASRCRIYIHPADRIFYFVDGRYCVKVVHSVSCMKRHVIQLRDRAANRLSSQIRFLARLEALLGLTMIQTT